MYKSNTPEEEKDLAETPWYVFNYFASIYNIGIDLAANANNKKHDRYIDVETNSLSVNWNELSSKNGWLNPPYSEIDPWMYKAIKHKKYFRTIMLIPTPNGESRFSLVEEHATHLFLIHGRIPFLRPDKTAMSGNTKGSCIIVFDDDRKDKCQVSWLKRSELETRPDKRLNKYSMIRE